MLAFIGCIMLIIISFGTGIGIPIIFFKVSRVLRNKIKKSNYENVNKDEVESMNIILLSIDEMFRPGFKKWYLVIFIRRLIMAVAVAFIPYYSNVISILLYEHVVFLGQ